MCLCFYPYVAPSGAEAFGCVSVSIHTLPLTGQRLLGVSLFLSIRCPERGNMCFGGIPTHTLPLTGQSLLGVCLFLPIHYP